MISVKPAQIRIGDVMVEAAPPQRRRKLTRDGILAAALRIIDREGLDACTMKTLSDALDVTPRALYRHVTSKTDLLRGVADAVLSEVILPDRGLSWTEQVVGIAAELRRVLMVHHHATVLCARRATVFPAVVPIVDVLIRAFEEAGLEPTRAIAFGHVLFNYVVGFSLSEADHLLNDPAERPAVDPLEGVCGEKVPFAAALGDDFRRYVAEAAFAADDQFAFGLTLLIEGLSSPMRTE